MKSPVITTTKKKKKRDKSRIIIIIFITFILFVSIGILLQPASTYSVKYISNTVVIFAVLYLNILLLAAFLIMLFRNIMKIIQERSQKVPGAKFSTRLIMIFSILTLVPTLFLFLVASDLLSTNVDLWFSQPVEVINQNSSKIISEVIKDKLVYVRSLARKLSAIIDDENLLESSDKLRERAKKFLNEHRVHAVHTYFISGSSLPVIVNDPSVSRLDIDFPKNQIDTAARGEPFAYHNTYRGRTVISAGYPVYKTSEESKKIIGTVIISSVLPEKINRLIQQSQSFYNDYSETKKQKINIKSTNILLLSLITLLLLFSASWLGLRVAREITVPIQKLIEGTNQISAGNLNYRVDAEAGEELGILVESFNRMSEELQISKKRFEESNFKLHESHKTLEEQYHYIETILTNIPAGILSVNNEGIISTINNSTAEMLGIEKDASESIHFKTVLRQRAYSELKKMLVNVNRKTGRARSKIIEIRPRKELKKIAVVCSPLRDDDGNHLGAVMVLEDLTELSRAQKIAAWREVARRVAHEIKNPLTPIQLSAQRLKKKSQAKTDDENLTGFMQECSEAILEEVFTLKRLVDEFSLFARMPEVKPVKSELNKIIQNSLSPYLASSNGVEIITDLQKLPKIMIDPEQMKRVIRNLMDNAIEAMSGIETRQVHIRTDKIDPRTVELTISDSGSGISGQAMDKIFVPYFSNKKKGTGLGLAIVKKIIDEHGGRISVRDNTPQGTTFIIQLPIGG